MEKINNIKTYSYLIKKIIRENFLNFNVDVKDLEAIGFLELIWCNENFNPKTDNTFISFAYKNIYDSLKSYIDNSINESLIQNNISINLPKGLTEKETKDLFLQKNNDDVRDKIINGNLWIVANIIHKFFKDEKDIDDLMSVGASALIDFVDKFIPYKTNNFYKMCTNHIYYSIKAYLSKEKTHLSLDEIVDNNQEFNFDLIDYSLENLKEKLENKEIIENVLTYLTDKEKTILLMWCNGSSTQEIAEKFNVSRNSALKSLNKVMKKVHIVYVGFKGAKYEKFEERIKKYK